MCNKDGTIRVLVLNNNRWWITGFIEDQNNGCKIINTSNKYYLGVFRQLENNQVPYLSYGYIIAPAKGIEDPAKGHKEEEEDIGIINSSLVLSSFPKFWKLYPKRVGKGAAEKSWTKIKEPVKTLELIKIALEWQKQTEQWKKNNGQFIPGPAVYLNQRRWEDEQNQTQPPAVGNYIP